jgi:hypothetical protein
MYLYRSARLTALRPAKVWARTSTVPACPGGIVKVMSPSKRSEN